VAYFLAGLGIGAIVALLFAPRSGEETREIISRKADEGREYVATKKRELRRKAEDAVTEARRKLEDLQDKGKEIASRIGLDSES
jgi:gas vesicle protein